MPADATPVLPRPPRAAPLLVGYSGGLDSTVLLHLLAADAGLRAHGLRAIHVHHGLDPRADDWAAHCAAECAALGIPLTMVRATVPRDGGEGLEAAARRVRHDAFGAALGEGEILALAHHRDDQAETFLLRALRGSGSDGLGAMRPWREYGRGWLWRPLLDLPRDALLAHARRVGLRWIEDPSNACEAHDRNYLRHQVLPRLAARWPRAAAALAQAAALQREATELLDQGDAEALARVRSLDPACLDADALRALGPPRRARVLRRWIAEAGLPPLPAEGVARIQRELLAEAPGEAARFGWRDAEVRRWRGLLWAGRRRPLPPGGTRLDWDGRTPLAWPGGGTLRLAPAPGDDGSADPPAPPFVVHPRAGGERITLPGRAHSHALKHVLQELGVPPWVRERLPLLSHPDGTLLAAGDLVLSAALDGWLRATGRRLLWTGTHGD